MFSELGCYCCICKTHMDWMKGYGRDQRCCCKECYEEFGWRRTLAVMGKAYYPDPRKHPAPVVNPAN